jgi:hypothetical protein
MVILDELGYLPFSQTGGTPPLYVPWDENQAISRTLSVVDDAGYGLIWDGPSSAYGVKVDLVRILIEFVVLTVLAGGAIVLTPEDSNNAEKGKEE